VPDARGLAIFIFSCSTFLNLQYLIVCCRVLDESLQKGLHRYLEVRGIKHTLHDWLYEYMMHKDEKEYVVWLKNMKEFVRN
jgi:hypothetical protein